MRKSLKVFLIIIGGIVCLWIFGSVTHTLQYFSVPSSANYPTIKPGGGFFASNLKKPKRFDFICYYATTPELGKQIWVHRLCGLEGDKIEIKIGDLYVNDESVDRNLSVAYRYALSVTDLNRVKEFETIDDYSVQRFSGDSAIICLSNQVVATRSINARREILPRDSKDEYIDKQYSKGWNQDHFGPVIVPTGKYFVLGDNRLSSQDSRYIGFIDKDDYVATSLIK